MTAELFSPLVERALRRAARAHRDHLRKASDLPYVTHLAGVALILARAGFDDEHVLAAALLHDVVEDTPCSLDELAAEFPPAVIEMVRALTERKYERDGRRRSWIDRKQEHLAQVAAAPAAARAIVLADKLHNLGAMVYDLAAGDELWSRFGAAPAQLLWYHRSMIDASAQNDPELQPLRDACNGLLDQVAAALPDERDKAD
jgi:(p)ppGpp synthase/HD superfamily hydrolase